MPYDARLVPMLGTTKENIPAHSWATANPAIIEIDFHFFFYF